MASIAGVPPFNGYVSLGLIHSGLRDSGQYVPYVVLLVAQAITIAALGRAAWLAFLKSRGQSYEQREKLRPGMRISLGALAACCLLFGVVPRYVLDHVANPAASALLGSGQYVAAVLNRGGAVTQLHTSFTYADPQELAIAVASVAAGTLAAWQAMRRETPRALELLRAVHNGSVNDYTGYAVGGVIAVVAAFLL